ncbi:ArsR/SmtB family transcription factor [Micromonospora craterilacus]|uniref:ArsR/SmtB family transcription factor n=1 Tax=Micromonospora craterilacus TaxID=1655439 RepID=UPI001314D550|nr:ArsR family transcriptional regulator [Micromonospora craterilacus]
MTVVYFDDDSLARIGIARQPLLEAEIAFSHQLIDTRVDPQFAAWHFVARGRLRGSTSVLPAILQGGRVADVIDTVGRIIRGVGFDTLRGGVLPGEADRRPWSRLRASREQQIKAALHSYHQAAIAPYWRQFLAGFNFERSRLVRVAEQGGPERLLADLGPGLRWYRPVLSLLDSVAATLHLRGRRVLILPSLFCQSGALLGETDDDHVKIIYPMSSISRSIALSGLAARGSCPLPELLGRTRAAILCGLTRADNTTGVAARWGITPATASRHLAILRAAGLIHSWRRANEMQHAISPMGHALVMSTTGAVDITSEKSA